MNDKIKLFIILLLFFFQGEVVLAHKMIIEPIKEGKVKVVYEDGSFSKRTVVHVYDHEGQEIQIGALDGEGYFYYDVRMATLLVASDGIGHRAEWQVGDLLMKTNQRWGVAVIVIVICLANAWFFRYRTKKKQHPLT